MSEAFLPIIAAVVAMLLLLGGMLVMVKKFYVRVKPSQALVVSTQRGRIVYRDGGMVFPIIHRADPIDLSNKIVRIERRGKEALITSEDELVEVDLVVTLRVGGTVEDILRVAERVGCEKTFDVKTVEELFSAKFTSAVKVVVRKMKFLDLLNDLHEVEDTIIEVIGKDLDGYVVERVALERIERGTLEATGPFR